MRLWLRRGLVGGVLVWGMVLAVQCEQPSVEAVDQASGPHTLYVVRHGWHAGIVLPRAALAPDAWPLLADVPATAYVEVGWGDAAYYPDRDPGLGTLLRAGLWPTASALHVAAFDEPVAAAFPRHDIAAVAVSDAGLRQVAAFLRSSTQAAPPIAPGRYHAGAFYPSPLSYHALNNCNQWAAGVLRAVGCNLAPRRTLRVTTLMREARACGRWIQSAP